MLPVLFVLALSDKFLLVLNKSVLQCYVFEENSVAYCDPDYEKCCTAGCCIRYNYDYNTWYIFFGVWAFLTIACCLILKSRFCYQSCRAGCHTFTNYINHNCSNIQVEPGEMQSNFDSTGSPLGFEDTFPIVPSMEGESTHSFTPPPSYEEVMAKEGSFHNCTVPS